jgi:hypothetical protein
MTGLFGLALDRPRMAAAAGYGVVIAYAAWHLFFFLTEPAVFFYDPFLGWFSGAIYDDVVGISATWVGYRAVNALALAALASAVLSATDPDTLRASAATLRRRRWGLHALTAALVLGALAAHGQRARIGYEIDREAIQEALGGRLDTEHFTLFFPAKDGRLAARIEALADDHEYRLAQLEAFFGAPFEGRVASYVYGSRARKRALMGADKVYVAKPWLGEVHLGPVDVGDGVIKHEIAHVYGANFASGPLHVSARWGLVPHMGLVEGFATAPEGWRSRLLLHQWAAALDELGKLPRIETLMGPAGYFNSYGPLAYISAGSLLRFVAETHGPEALLRLYGTGDFEDATGQTLPALTEAWKTALRDRSRIPLDPEELDRARFLFDRKPLLARACPLVVARTEADSARLASRRAWDEVSALLAQVVAWRPDDPSKRAALARALAAAGRTDDARRQALDVLDDDRTVRSLRARTEELLGDLEQAAGDLAAARQRYVPLVTAPWSESDQRRIAVKVAALDLPDSAHQTAALRYLSGAEGKDALRRLETDPSWVSAYLRGRRAALDGEVDAARPQLLAALNAPELPRHVRAEAERMLGRLAFGRGEWDEAIRRFGAAHDAMPPGALGLRAEQDDWIERCRWAAEREARAPR